MASMVDLRDVLELIHHTFADRLLLLKRLIKGERINSDLLSITRQL